MMTLSLRFSFIIALMVIFLGTVTVIHDQLLRGADEDEDQSKYANCETWYDSEVQNYTRIGQCIVTELFESTIQNGTLVEFYIHELMSNYP